MNLKFQLLTEFAVKPNRATAGSAGFDLFVPHGTFVNLPQKERTMILTDIAVAIPYGYVGHVCSRSGLAYAQQVSVLNAPGIIDSDYRGNIGVILYNHGTKFIRFSPLERIAQLLILPVMMPEMELVEDLDSTERGEGGFGSTGE